ncbi:hypothetical protein QBC32DRAFT_400266 [Pseudoneurospora amorphoporcata]|uniref:Uncharacterized protein n=1 Tax=Pseudoneurospora amorphoporcata TaxID=241081 RepID=A0AAN6NNZ6_9PEZI|nr:hypothetical protein QBC32DRAFT_400266 [Pseudoneurospora amorphoporcata]
MPGVINDQSRCRPDLPFPVRSIHCFRTTDRPVDHEWSRPSSTPQDSRGGPRASSTSECFLQSVEDNITNVNHPSESNKMQLDAFVTRTSGLLSRIAASANFSFQSDQDQATFNRALISLLKNPDSSLPNGHITGLCCSSLLSIQFPDESRGSNDLIPEFRSFVLAASLAHRGRRNGNKGSSSSGSRQKPQACPARHESRSHLIRRLDDILTSQLLSNLSSGSCRVLFHLVLGAVLGLGHSPSPTTTSFFNSPSSSSSTTPSNLLSSEFQQSPTLWLSTKNQLVRTLAQDLVFLGNNKLGIILEGTDLENLIIDMAISRWNEMESRVWVDSIAAEKAPSTRHEESAQQPMPSLPSSPSKSTRKRRSSTSTADDNLNQDRTPPYWEDSPPTPPPPTVEPTLIPVMPPSYHNATHFQYQFQFQAPSQFSTSSSWSQNPASYLEMTDEAESYYLATANDNKKRGRAAEAAPTPLVTAMPRSMTDPFPLKSPSEDFGPWRKVKRRTMWVVRMIDAGAQGQISVHARLRGREVNDFGLFV